MGTRTREQSPWWIAASALPKSAGHPFYARLTPAQISPDLLALIPFAAMVVILYLAGRGKILSGRKQ